MVLASPFCFGVNPLIERGLLNDFRKICVKENRKFKSQSLNFALSEPDRTRSISKFSFSSGVILTPHQSTLCPLMILLPSEYLISSLNAWRRLYTSCQSPLAKRFGFISYSQYPDFRMIPDATKSEIRLRTVGSFNPVRSAILFRVPLVIVTIPS